PRRRLARPDQPQPPGRVRRRGAGRRDAAARPAGRTGLAPRPRHLRRTGGRIMSEHPGQRRLWPYLIPLLVIIVALLGTVFFPFVNPPPLWFGLPSVGVWSALWVLAIAPALVLVEHLSGYARADDRRGAGASGQASADGQAGPEATR